MSTFKISIIVPTYHCVERINDVISCLQQQTIGFQSLEILLSDDGSFDGTAQKMLHFLRNMQMFFLCSCRATPDLPEHQETQRFMPPPLLTLCFLTAMILCRRMRVHCCMMK